MRRLLGLGALFLCLTGSAAALALVTGRQVADGSLARKDFSGRTQGARGPAGPAGRDGARGVPGSAGTAGRQGPRGPVGATGAAGGRGEPGVTGANGPVGAGGSDAEIVATLLANDGTASQIDADRLDGLDASTFSPLVDVVLRGGSAGGSLLGSYPDPKVAGNAVNSQNVAPETLTDDDLAPDSAGRSELLTGSVGFDELRTERELEDIDPPSLAAGACDVLLVSGSFGQVGDWAIARSLDPLPNGIYLVPASVGTLGHTPVQTCNGSTAAINPSEFLAEIEYVR